MLSTRKPLEWINGHLFANRLSDNRIFQIDPWTGEVTGIIDLSELAEPEQRLDRTRVLNGIAWDHENQHLLVTGKFWQRAFKLKLDPVPNNP